MPTYVYACDSCGAQFEQFQSFKDEPLRDCPRCAQAALRRVFQPVGIVFKGSGWYITDSRGASSTATAPDADKGKADKADKADKAEVAAEAKTEKAEPSEKSSEPATKPASSPAPAPAA